MFDRKLNRMKRRAKRLFPAAIYGWGIAWTVGAASLYTPFALAVVGAAMVLTAVVAAGCALVSGE